MCALLCAPFVHHWSHVFASPRVSLVLHNIDGHGGPNPGHAVRIYQYMVPQSVRYIHIP